jgi:hypothetical protein
VVDLRPLARRAHHPVAARPTVGTDGNAVGEGSTVNVSLDADVERFRAAVRAFFVDGGLRNTKGMY